jgi:type IV secretory pathway TrbD component
MSQRRFLSRQVRTTIVNGILCVVLILVLMQLWLITATMNAWLGGDDAIVWPAALASAVCFLLNAGLLWHLFQLDR